MKCSCRKYLSRYLPGKRVLTMIDPDNETAQVYCTAESQLLHLYTTLLQTFSYDDNKNSLQSFIISKLSALPCHEDFVMLLVDDYRPLRKGNEYFIPIELREVSIQYAHGHKAR